MNPSNEYYLERLLEPWIGLADDDDAIIEYKSVDPNNEHEMKSIILADLGPHLAAKSAEDRLRIMSALREALLTNGIDFGRLHEANLPPFKHPKNPRDLFQWIWDIFSTEYSLR